MLAAETQLAGCAKFLLVLRCFFVTGEPTFEFALRFFDFGEVPSQWPCLNGKGSLMMFHEVFAA